jgi:cytochrome c-type biogenesis protein CcmF
VGALLLLLGAGSSKIGLVAYTFAAFVLASIVYEFARGTRARHALSGGSWFAAFFELVGRNRRRYGGYIVHASIVLLAIGIVGSSAYDTVREQTLTPGQTMAIGGYRLTYDRLVSRDGPNATEVRAILDVRRDGDRLGTLASGKNNYRAEQQVSNEVGIRSDPLTGEDLFVIADKINTDESVVFKVFVKPLVNLIWAAGFVFFVGALVAMWPSAAEQRRLAARYRELRVFARA